jgi:amino acid adenylation domain-containing protein
MSDISLRISELSPEKLAQLVKRFRQEVGLVTPESGIVRRKNGRHAPLSFSQQRLWFLSQLAPNTAAYNVPAGIRLAGHLDLSVLERSLNEIVRRHESLRSSIATIAGELVQLVVPSLTLKLPVVDLRDLPAAEREAEVIRLATTEAQQLFDLGCAPLLRAKLLWLDVSEHVLLLSLHHLIADGWSIGIFVRELTVLYNAFSAGEASPLSELSIQYGDYAQWQQERLQGEVIAAQGAYWKKQLAGAPAILQFPTNRPRPIIQSFHGAILSSTLPTSLATKLKELSRSEGATLFMTLLTGFNALLSRYCGEEDIVIGTPIANRTRAEVEGLIGFFVNTLVLRTDLAGDPTFREMMKRVREVCLAGFSHQDMPFEKLVEEIEPERSLSHNPLFQVMFIVQNAPREKLALNSLVTSPVVAEGKVALFDLTLLMEEQPQGLQATLQYSTDLFDAVTVERLMDHFQRLLEGAVANPDQRLSELQLLSEQEREQVLVEFNDTQRAFPGEVCVHQLFEQQAAATPAAIALVFGEQEVSYGELNSRANQLGHHLRRLGVGPEVVVGICVERSIEMVVGLLAVLKAGGAYLPLDPGYPPERLSFMLADARPAVLLTTQRVNEGLPLHESRVMRLDADWHLLTENEQEQVASGVRAENPAYVIYTSGSTGQPKGVVVCHGGVSNLYEEQARVFGLRKENRVLQFASLSFDASVFEIVMALGTGATLVLATREELLPGPPLLELLRKQAISNLTIPPSALALLPAAELSALGTVIVAGDACAAEVMERWAEGREFYNAYGPTEATIWASVKQCRVGEGRPSIGKPIGNVELYVLDGELQPVPNGVTGELYIGGAGLARGYLYRPELTAERFIPHPFSVRAGARLYQTGDLARYHADGNIEFLGRVDHQVKLRGYRIELGEIEAVLGSHEQVSEVVVLARGGAASGEQRLVGYVVRQPGAQVGSGELREYLKQRLPDYMIPAALVLLEQLPLTANGKVDRRALPAPELSRVDPDGAYVPPQSEVERAIAGVWQEILQVEKVGRHDNFFDLGGHSLLLMKVRDKLAELFEQEVTITEIFKYPTVNSLAEYLTQERPTNSLLTRSHDRAEGRKALTQLREQFRAKHKVGKRSSLGVQDE